MDNQTYDKLADALNNRNYGFRSVPCNEFYALARELYTPEQAEIAAAMPRESVVVEELVGMVPGADLTKLKSSLEEMADKGLVLATGSGSKICYELLPLGPGAIEFQFLKSQADEHSKRIARLFMDYVKAMSGQKKTSSFSLGPVSGTKRVIPVRKTPIQIAMVLPYDEVIKLIERTEYIASGTCHCRQMGELLNRPCSNPRENICMILGSTVEPLATRGLIQQLSNDEAKHNIEVADKAGLVHCYSTGSTLRYLCNCCGCHCLLLKPIMRSLSPSNAVKADWVVTIENGACIGCGACIDRCWMGTLKMENSLAIRDTNRCIGCGLCVSVCPTDAIRLVQK